MKATVSRLRVRALVVERVTKLIEVYDAPITEVTAAAHRTMPNMRRPMSPAAAWKAEAARLSLDSTAPEATTPRIARNRRARIRPVTRIEATELRVMSWTSSTPFTPESIMRWAPA